MKLTKPLIIFDLETTGVQVVSDRIVQIAAVKIFPDGTTEEKEMLLHPTCDIPVEATAVHGITNEMVATAPTFKQIAKALKEYFYGCDIGGYNSDEFDLPMLIMEFHRCQIEFPDWDLNQVDILKLERKLNSHKLGDTYKRYTGKELDDSHHALVDAKGAFAVLQEQLSKYFQGEQNAAAIDEFIQGEQKRYDYAGKTYIQDGVVYWSFGKCKDKPVLDDRGYLNWALNAGFPLETQRKLKDLLYNNPKSNEETI